MHLLFINLKEWQVFIIENCSLLCWMWIALRLFQFVHWYSYIQKISSGSLFICNRQLKSISMWTASAPWQAYNNRYTNIIHKASIHESWPSSESKVCVFKVRAIYPYMFFSQEKKNLFRQKIHFHSSRQCVGFERKTSLHTHYSSLATSLLKNYKSYRFVFFQSVEFWIRNWGCLLVSGEL